MISLTGIRPDSRCHRSMHDPLQTKWDEPEDPKYLLPLPEPKDADFITVRGCKVFASELGYRLQSQQQGYVGRGTEETG